MVAPSDSPKQQEAPPLCPSCGNPVVRIATSVEVKYLVHYAATARHLEILAEQLGDSDWDEDTAATCDRCNWRGTVGELRRADAHDENQAP